MKRSTRPRRIPAVVIGHHRARAMHFDTVNGDDETGAGRTIDHLVASGIEKITHISPDISAGEDNWVPAHRELGYRRAMERHGLSRHAEVHYAEHGPLAGNPARMLMERIKGRQKPEHLVIETRLIVRGSTLGVSGKNLSAPDS